MTKAFPLTHSNARTQPRPAHCTPPRHAATGPIPRATLKPGVIILAPEHGIGDAIARVAETARAHWTANIAAACDGRDAEGVHQVRVGLRRFRSALSIFRKHLPKPQRQWLNGEARWLLAELGPARDLDVFIGELLPSATGPAARTRLHRAGLAARHVAQERARAALQSQRYTRFMRRLEAWLSGRGWQLAGDDTDIEARSASLGTFAARALNKRLIHIQARGKDIRALPIAELHELRIEIKKVRYGVEFFQSALPQRRVVKLAAILKDLQESLGHLNDLAVAEEIVGQLTRADPRLESPGTAIVAHYRQTAADAIQSIAPRWQKLRKFGLL